MDPLPLKDFNLIVETKNPAEKVTLQWSIKNVNKLPKQIRSSKFSLVPGKPSEWDMMICHSPDNNKVEMRLAYHAQRDSAPIEIESFVKILKNEGSLLKYGYVLREHNLLFHGGDQHSLGSWPEFPVSEEDTLIFQCSMSVHGYSRVNSRNLYSEDFDDIEDLRNDYLRMLKSEEFSDKNLEWEGKVFPVHKCVLRSLAPELHDLNQWIPRHGGDVNILTVSPTMFEDVLQYIYSGKVKDVAIASEHEMYYSFALDFKLKCLLRKSLKVIINIMHPRNVRAILIVAQDYKDKELMKYCEIYMKDNPES